MTEIITHVLLHSVIDSLKTLPFLFGVYLLMEFMEHKTDNKMEKFFRKTGPFGAIGGATLGLFPQCGFSVAASNLYVGRVISAGTLMAVYIATSDEAIPIILAHPDKISVLWKLLLCKFIIAVVFGMVIDLIIRFVLKNKQEEKPFEEICEGCGCEHGILRSAIRHTIGIFLAILIVNLVLGFVIELVGEDKITSALMTIKPLQPVISAFIGLIPNCSASVVLTELYLKGGLTFGSLVGGLSTGAGMGLVVLFRTNRKHLKESIFILIGLILIGILSGTLIDLIGIGV
ncbi:MAG: arsenic efflux protein [Oscillospiraceae bacterium]|nr:arsenic efflux protein [Oscillospiraceae bacterium]